MITVVSALKGELAPLSAYFHADKRMNFSSGTLYAAGQDLHFLRCGVGGEVCQKVLSDYLNHYRPSVLINIGTAGMVNPLIKQGDLFCIDNIYHLHNDMVFSAHVCDVFEKAVLLTVDDPLTDPNLRKLYFSKYAADIVDMEAWYCAHIAAEHKIPFHSWKIVSDSSDENTEKDFMQNYRALTQRLAEKSIPILEKMLK